MTNEMIAIIEKLPQELRDTLVTQDDNGNYVINGDKFQDTLDKAIGSERDLVTELFFRKLCEDQWKEIGWDKIQEILPVLQHICNDVGFKEVDNPFLNFIKQFYTVNSDYTLKKNDLAKLNNLYAKDVLSYEELTGKDTDSDLSIIYNKDLYSEDVEKLYKTWKWLSNASNVKKMNWKEVANTDSTKNIQEMANKLASGENVDLDTIRKTIFYVEPNDINSGLNSSTIIDKVMKTSALNNVSKDSGKSVEDKSKSIKDEVVNLFDKSNLTTNEKKDLINQILSTLGYNK